MRADLREFVDSTFYKHGGWRGESPLTHPIARRVVNRWTTSFALNLYESLFAVEMRPVKQTAPVDAAR